PATTRRHPLSLHDALPILTRTCPGPGVGSGTSTSSGSLFQSISRSAFISPVSARQTQETPRYAVFRASARRFAGDGGHPGFGLADRKSTRLNSSHVKISYA